VKEELFIELYLARRHVRRNMKQSVVDNHKVYEVPQKALERLLVVLASVLIEELGDEFPVEIAGA
jgi:hypothetical protein